MYNRYTVSMRKNKTFNGFNYKHTGTHLPFLENTHIGVMIQPVWLIIAEKVVNAVVNTLPWMPTPYILECLGLSPGSAPDSRFL